MSNPEGNGDHAAWSALDELEGVVDAALAEVEQLRRRAAEIEAEHAEMTELLRRFTQDEESPGRLLTRLETLEGENADLRDRLERGRDGVKRMLARIRFMEEQA